MCHRPAFLNGQHLALQPGVNTFTGRSVSYRTGLSNGRTSTVGVQRRSAETMVADGGKVLVSGFLNSKERTDQFVFDILQAQGKWEKIVAFSEDMVFAKKRLVSRKSRYSGLLDVLEFVEGDKYDAATMDEKLQDVSAWLCFDCEADKIKDSVGFAKKAGVKNMVISSTVSAADAESAGVEDTLKVRESGLDAVCCFPALFVVGLLASELLVLPLNFAFAADDTAVEYGNSTRTAS